MDEKNVQAMRQRDSWEDYFSRDSESELIKSVMEMEENSEWIPGITAKEIRLEAIDEGPLFIQPQMQTYHLDDQELFEETAQFGTKLLIYTGIYRNGHSHELVRDTAVSGLHRVARLNGNSLGQMTR